MARANSARYDDMPRTKAYLLVYSHERNLRRDSLDITATCYSISLPQLENVCETTRIDEGISYHTLEQAIQGGHAIIERTRSSMAGELVMQPPAMMEQDCVLITRSRWDKVQKDLKRNQKFSRLWKRLAKRYFNALSFLGGE